MAGMWNRLRKFFHWKFSGVLIPFFIALGGLVLSIGASLAETEKSLFIAAYVFFALAGLWTVGYWLTSDTLNKRNPRTWNRNRRRQSKLRLAVVIYHLWLWGGILACAAGLVVAVLFTDFVWDKKELSGLEGRLYPGTEKPPGNGCEQMMSTLKNGTAFLFDNGNGAVVTDFPHIIASMRSEKMIPDCLKRCPVLSVGKDDQDGYIYVVMDVRDKDNKVIVQLDKDGFHINPNNSFRIIRRNRSSLTVKDQEGHTALDITYLNPRYVAIDGTLFIHGQRLPLQIRNTANVCTSSFGSSDFGMVVP